MKVRIAQHITTDQYAHYPGQIMIDHPDERAWLAEGIAVPVPEASETPTPVAETAQAPETEVATQPTETRAGKRSRR